MPASTVAELFETRQIVAGEEPVDEGQRRAHPAGERLVLGMALQRVHPHDRVRGAREPSPSRAPTSAGSSRSQPSETITTTAPRESARRP